MAKVYSSKNTQKIVKVRHPESQTPTENANVDARLSLLESGLENLSGSLAPLGSLKWSLTEIDDLAWLPLGSDPVLIENYQGLYNKYNEMGILDLIEDANVDDGKPTSTAGYFYATLPPHAYARSATKEEFLSSDINGSTNVITLSDDKFNTGLRGNSPIVWKVRVYTNGSLTGTGLAVDTDYYIGRISANTYTVYTTESNAVADTSRISLTQTGSGTHWFSDVGIRQSDAFQVHGHILKIDNLVTGGGQLGRGANTGSNLDTGAVTTPQSISGYGSQRSGPETRPATMLAYGYVRALDYAGNPLSSYSNSIYYELRSQLDTLQTEVNSLIDFTDNGQENDWINSDLSLWQRGTSFISIANSKYAPDRIKTVKIGSMVYDITRSTDVPDNSVPYSINVEITTAQTSIGANDYSVMMYTVEGYDFRKYVSNGYGVLKLSYKTNVTGTYNISFRAGEFDASYVAPFVVDTANAWDSKTFIIPFNSPYGTWYYDEKAGVSITIALVNGSTYQSSSSDQWLNGNYLSTTNQANLASAIGNYFRIAKPKFEPGKIASPYVSPNRAYEIARSQRYYEKSYNIDVAPGAITNNGMATWCPPIAYQTQHGLQKVFNTNKRITPTMIWYSNITGAINQVRAIGADQAVTGNTNEGTNNTGAPITSSTLAGNSTVAAHWIADAEL